MCPLEPWTLRFGAVLLTSGFGFRRKSSSASGWKLSKCWTRKWKRRSQLRETRFFPGTSERGVGPTSAPPCTPSAAQACSLISRCSFLVWLVCWFVGWLVWFGWFVGLLVGWLVWFGWFGWFVGWFGLVGLVWLVWLVWFAHFGYGSCTRDSTGHGQCHSPSWLWQSWGWSERPMLGRAKAGASPSWLWRRVLSSLWR